MLLKIFNMKHSIISVYYIFGIFLTFGSQYIYNGKSLSRPCSLPHDLTSPLTFKIKIIPLSLSSLPHISLPSTLSLGNLPRRSSLCRQLSSSPSAVRRLTRNQAGFSFLPF
ncbi:hypothetical protein Dimus_038869 [Dionaea muscipula]